MRLTQLHGEPDSVRAGPSAPWHSIELGEPLVHATGRA
jgi:hypothetical protein